MSDIENTLKMLNKAVQSGSLWKANKNILESYESALCRPQAFTYFGESEFPQVCDAVRLQLLRAHIDSLQSHITTLDSKNTTLQKLVIALATASLIGSGSQIWFAHKADKRFERKPTQAEHLQIKSTKKPESSSPSQGQEPAL